MREHGLRPDALATTPLRSPNENAEPARGRPALRPEVARVVDYQIIVEGWDNYRK
jgi:hypothetical protein